MKETRLFRVPLCVEMRGSAINIAAESTQVLHRPLEPKLIAGASPSRLVQQSARLTMPEAARMRTYLESQP